MKNYITTDPKIMQGAPVIKGTRIPIEVILYRLKDGNSVKEIHNMYPWVPIQAISGAIEEAIQTINLKLNAKKVSQA